MHLFMWLIFISGLLFVRTALTQECEEETVTIAILAKDKAHCLPLYLQCIEQQTWPRAQTYLYIRTNNNNDNTAELLQKWITKVGKFYKEVYFDSSDVPQRVQDYGQHEWNALRLSVLAHIREHSLKWAYERKSHYFISDCDNFIKPHTLESLVNTGLPIVAPLIRSTDNSYWANYFGAVDGAGYYKESPLYYQLLYRIKGIVEVPLVHCTYLIRHEYLNKIYYKDGSDRYEFIIFSESARKHGIPQYIDTRELYGRNSSAENVTQLYQEPWIKEFINPAAH